MCLPSLDLKLTYDTVTNKVTIKFLQKYKETNDEATCKNIVGTCKVNHPILDNPLMELE